MKLSKQTIFDASPWWAKRVLANAEALRRTWFRQGPEYHALLPELSPARLNLDPDRQATVQLESLNRQLFAAARTVPYYRDILPKGPLESLDEMADVPVLTKDMVRNHKESLKNPNLSPLHYWESRTSGSTGTPLSYYQAKSSITAHTAAYHALLDYFGCPYGAPKVRISGVSVLPPSRTEPPYWIYIDWFKQWQFSSFHLGPHSFDLYLAAMTHADAAFATGYAGAWNLLAAYVEESGAHAPRFRAIITDAEGVDNDKRRRVERVFDTRMVQTYGTSEVGPTMVQCPHGRYHTLFAAKLVELLDKDGTPVTPGQMGEITITDLHGSDTPFIRYRTGDLAVEAAQPCPCGWKGQNFPELLGRLDDSIVTPDGREITRLGFITKAAVGIKESQLVQTAADRLVIRVVPGEGYSDATRLHLLNTARHYLGESMKLGYETVDRLPRTPSGKVKYMVREMT